MNYAAKSKLSIMFLFNFKDDLIIIFLYLKIVFNNYVMHILLIKKFALNNIFSN